MSPFSIATRSATERSIPELGTPGRRAKHAVDDRGRQYYAKTEACAKYPGELNPAWLVNELIFYSVAAQNGLKMPGCCILELNGGLAWGCEFIAGRVKLPLFPGGDDALKRACAASPTQACSLARGLLLDLALLNSDRTTANILASGAAESPELWFFDHDKALLGDGRFPGDLWRIRMTDDEFESKVPDWLSCTAANRVVTDVLTDKAICEIFLALALGKDALRTAFADCPPHWVDPTLLRELEAFLLRWWAFLASKVDRLPGYLRLASVPRRGHPEMPRPETGASARPG